MSSEPYDSTADTVAHRKGVATILLVLSSELAIRAVEHDVSKLEEPEKSCFDKWTPMLRSLEYNSPEYKEALVQMGEGLQHHFKENRHHAEHFVNGINGMSLIDVLEMVVDWYARASTDGKAVNMESNAQRYGIGDQLRDILNNTLKELERGS